MIVPEARLPRVRRGFKVALFLALLLLAHATWDYIESRRLHARLDAIVRKGEPIATNRYVQLTGGAAQSDRFYRAAAALVSGYPDVDEPVQASRITQALRDGQWPADVVGFARSLLERHAEALSLVDRAAALPFESFAPGTEYSYRVSSLWSLSRLCEVRAAIRALDGRADDAADSIYSDARLARALPRLQPFTVLPFVYSRARPSAAASAKLAAALAELDRDDRIKQDFLQQRAQLLNGRERGLANVAWIARPWVVHNLTRQLDVFAALITAAERPPADRVNAILAVGAWPTLFNVPPDRTRLLLESFTKSLATGIDQLHCARRLVAGEMVDCHF